MSRLLEKKADKMKENNAKNKEKDKGLKLREKEAREREVRSGNGHFFTSITVSATTLCSSCNRSITAKEALCCPGCNVTIHNRCRDSLPCCAKMKQKQTKLTLSRNSSALQNVSMRTKSQMLKERPTSAIYPSELRLSKRVRSSLSLSKSVSTNNIAGAGDEAVGLRRILSQSSESLNFRSRTLSLESLTDEGEQWWSPLLDELQKDTRGLHLDSWSCAVEPSFLQTQHKDVIRQQDVIYELMQTELHHVRTLRIMELFRRGMLEEVQLEPGLVHSLFPVLDQLLELHSPFLQSLLQRREAGLQEGSYNNYTIQSLGDLLVKQFSGSNADELKNVYSEFCSRHPKAVQLYKEVLARDRRLQQFIRRVSRGPLLRRHGVPECTLLVTQRITKYPVLLQRILDCTKDPEEASVLSKALKLLKDLLSSIDREVLELERSRRLQEIQNRLDPRAEARVRGGVFRSGELHRRRLLHEGALQWRVQGSRMKEVRVLLMNDVLVFLQDKDQKFTFASLDKSPVVSLTGLIVRDIANQEKGLYLISDCTPPEMYELHTSSKEERKTWINKIQQTALTCPSRADFPLIETEDKALLRRLRAEIQQKDREVLELLQERLTLFSDLVQATSPDPDPERPKTDFSRRLFRSDSGPAPQAEPLLNSAICEVEKLSELMMDCKIQRNANPNPQPITDSAPNGCVNGPSKEKNENQLQESTLTQQDVCQRLVALSSQLHALQAAVIRQDSLLELSIRLGPTPQSAGVGQDGEAGLLRRQVTLLQQEVTRLHALVPLAELKRHARAPLADQEEDAVDATNENASQRSDSPRDLQDIPEESET
ncbi:rho guanine nucleotide exchange factor 2-like isoform X3 [Eucyclogobius newberryi]|uniref:rho guanine nucleotide exchange factor 2-like isoform X3 n=1 Tax=Eucyclogobius newberryi TaxID=166745 RepID=UPI003B5A4A60